MAVKSDKHANAEQIYYGDFSGGMNLSLPAEALEKNEMRVAENMEYDPSTGALKLRAGLALVGTLPSPIRNIAPVAGGSDAMLVRCTNNYMYRLKANSTPAACGSISGDGDLSCAPWGDGDELVLCAGKHLYYYDGSVVTEVASSPEKCDLTFVRNGRVGVVDSLTDAINYSGVGDCTNWQFASNGVDDPWTEADAISINVGYKDGCDLVCVAPLTTDLVVFKSPAGRPGAGRVYRVTGTYPNWEVKDVAQGSSAWNHKSAKPTTSDLLFLTAEGVASLGTVSDYGDVKMNWPGRKVNARISAEIGADCAMWRMPSASQIWVKSKAGNRVWVYSYGVGSGGAWTYFNFPDALIDACDTGINRYVAIGSSVYRLDDTASDDNGKAFSGLVRMGAIRKMGMILLKQIYVAYSSMSVSSAKFNIEGYKIALPLGGQLGHVAANDNEAAALDDEPLVSATSAAVRTRVNIRVWDATAELAIDHGPFNLNAIGLEVVEV
jgi:hypothetical protein